MLEIKIKDDSQSAFENGMRIFKKMCQKDGFMLELRERRYYKKPSIKRREIIREALRKQKNAKKARDKE